MGVNKIFAQILYIFIYVILLFPIVIGPYSWLLSLIISIIFYKVFENKFHYKYWLLIGWIITISILVYINSGQHSVFIYSIAAIAILSINFVKTHYLIVEPLILKFSKIILIIFLCLMWFLSKEGERSVSFYGDPNFAALFIFTIAGMILLLEKSLNEKSFFGIFFLAMVSISAIFMTGSRALMLGFFIYLLVDYFRSLYLKKIFTTLIMMSAVFLQPLIFILWNIFDFQVTGYSSISAERLMILNDTSNYLRVELAYISLINFFNQDIFSILLGGYGSGNINVETQSGQTNIAHNYFIQFLMYYGLIYAITIQFILFVALYFGTVHNLPFIACMIFIASVLSSVAVFLMLVILVIEKIYFKNINSSKNKPKY